MSRFIRPKKDRGFDLDSVESWYYSDENNHVLALKMKSGKETILYAEAADVVHEALCDISLKMFED